MIVVVIVIAIMLHVIHGAAIALFEAFAKIVASFSLIRRVFVQSMVISIGVTVLAVILPGGFNALMETALLRVAIISCSSVPTVVVLVLCSTWSRLCFMGTGVERAG